MKSDHNTCPPVDAPAAPCRCRATSYEIVDAPVVQFDAFGCVVMDGESITKSVEDWIVRSSRGETLCWLLLAAGWIIWLVAVALVVFA